MRQRCRQQEQRPEPRMQMESRSTATEPAAQAMQVSTTLTLMSSAGVLVLDCDSLAASTWHEGRGGAARSCRCLVADHRMRRRLGSMCCSGVAWPDACLGTTGEAETATAAARVTRRVVNCILICDVVVNDLGSGIVDVICSDFARNALAENQSGRLNVRTSEDWFAIRRNGVKKEDQWGERRDLNTPKDDN